MLNVFKHQTYLKYKCIIFFVTFVVCSVIFNITSYAYSNFLTKPYSMTDCSFENYSDSANFVSNKIEYANDAFGIKGKSLVLNGGDNNIISYIPSQNGLYGKTQISFNFAAECLSGSSLVSFYGADCSLNNESEILCLEFLPKEFDENIMLVNAVYSNGEKEFLTETSVKMWNEISIQIDTELKICNIQINAQFDIMAYLQGRKISFENSGNEFCLTKVKFLASNNYDIMYIDDFRVERSGVFSTQPIVEAHGNGLYTMGAKINNASLEDKTYVAYIALYKDKQLKKIYMSDKKRVSRGNDDFIEFFVQSDMIDYDELKTFVWEYITNDPVDEPFQTTVDENGNLAIKINEDYANFDMQPNKFGSWYILGEYVRFSSATQLSDNVTQIEGIITDLNGNFVDEVIVSGNSFKTKGWRWKPEQPGFYQIQFYAVINDIYTVPVYTTYTRTDLVQSGIKFNSYVRNVVVVPAETKSIENRNPKMAFSYQTFDSDALVLADKIGFSTARIHSIPWGAQFTDADAAIHIGPGKFNWTDFDAEMTKIKEYGFDIVGNILYTPKWASPSKSDNILICVREYSTYAPTDMLYLEEFLDALIKRYGDDINIWEIWNEPHLPGASVFWNDTPEKYVELLKTAYAKIKGMNPEDEVWIGGIGARRYLPFYSEILRLGAYPYFDKLSMHGYDVDPWNYNNIAQSMGLEPKEWANTEGHYILTSAGVGTDAFISEKRTAFRLMIELLRQFKYDAQLITKFTIYDWNTIDVMSWAEDNAVHISSDGLFQKTKNIEPRLCAIVMHSFLENIGKDTEFVSELKFTETQQGVILKCDGEDVVLLWSTAEENEEASFQVKEIMSDNTIIRNWEFKDFNKENFVLEPYVVYYIKNFNSDKIHNFIVENGEIIYSEYEKQKQQLNGPVTDGNVTDIFEHRSLSVRDSISWVEDKYKWNGNKMADGYDLKFSAGLCTEGLDLIIDVNDKNYLHNSRFSSDKQDYIEIGIDTLGNGIATDKIVMRITWDENLNFASVIKTQAPNFVGDIPDNWTVPGSEIANKTISVSRTDNTIRYLIHISYSELYPYYADSDKIHFSIVSYNYDNGIYNGYYEWGGGLAFNMNTPSKYGIINFKDRVHIKTVSNGIKVSGKAIADTPLCMIVENDIEEVKFVSQALSDANGYYEFTVPLEKGDYYISIGGPERNKSSIHYNG